MAQNYTVDNVALELIKEISESDAARLKTLIGLQKICVFGNYEKNEKEISTIAESLCSADYPATFLKKIPKTILLPDFEIEKAAIDKASVLVVIDSNKGGLVSESTYLMDNPELMEKSILLVPENTHCDTLYSTEKHYVYYHSKIQYKEENLVEIAIKAAKQASHRLALYKIFSEKEANKK